MTGFAETSDLYNSFGLSYYGTHNHQVNNILFYVVKWLLVDAFQNILTSIVMHYIR